MTTKFNSFDASPLGAFVQSPLGARNTPSILLTGNPLHLAVIFIDEATEAEVGDGTGYRGWFDGLPHLPDERWRVDVERWDAARISHGERSLGAACLILHFPSNVDPLNPWERLWPFGFRLPLGIRMKRVLNEVDVPVWKQHVEDFVRTTTNSVLEDVWFFVDRSGSFGLQDVVLRAIADWATELTNNQVTVFTRTFADERWLRQAARV